MANKNKLIDNFGGSLLGFFSPYKSFPYVLWFTVLCFSGISVCANLGGSASMCFLRFLLVIFIPLVVFSLWYSIFCFHFIYFYFIIKFCSSLYPNETEKYGCGWTEKSGVSGRSLEITLSRMNILYLKQPILKIRKSYRN